MLLVLLVTSGECEFVCVFRVSVNEPYGEGVFEKKNVLHSIIKSLFVLNWNTFLALLNGQLWEGCLHGEHTILGKAGANQLGIGPFGQQKFSIVLAVNTSIVTFLLVLGVNLT